MKKEEINALKDIVSDLNIIISLNDEPEKKKLTYLEKIDYIVEKTMDGHLIDVMFVIKKFHENNQNLGLPPLLHKYLIDSEYNKLIP